LKQVRMMTRATDQGRCIDCGRPTPRPPEGERRFSWCFTCTAERAAERAEEIARELFPHGYREGRRWWRIGDIDGTPGQSFAVELVGRKRGRCFDYESHEGGDLIDAAARRYGGRLAGLQWLQDWLHAPWREPAPGRRPPVERPEDVGQGVKRIWRAAKPLQAGDMVWRYLTETRGIALDKLPEIPVTLRAHPRLLSTLAERYYPAMTAAVASPEGKPAGVHRTYLSLVGGRVDKAPIPDRRGPTGGAKRSYGAIAGNCIPLTRGSDGRPWHAPLPNSLLAIGEGIEDCLSIATARPEWRVACAVSLSNMLGLVLPPQITEIMLLVQNDEPGSKAAALVPRIVRRFQQQGRKVTVLRPRDRQIKDVNDLVKRASHGNSEVVAR
jgi:Toprim domain